MPCCKCNGSGARCKGCSCAKSNKGCVDCYPGRRAAHPATDLQARRDPPESQLQLPQSQLPQSQAQLLSSHSEDERRTVFLEESNPQSQLQTLLTTRPQPPFTPAANGLAPFQLSASQPSPYSGSQEGSSRRQPRKPCPVEGCLELIAPSMGKAHMTLHVQNILPGDVPLEWLQEQDSFVCLSCHHIVANSRFGSHSTKCSGSTTGVGPLQAQVASTTAGSSQGDVDDSNAPLPSFEEVCSLRCATVHHIPQKARPAFARALSETLRAICQLNTEEAWLKLFMLPKCVLRASHRGGSRHKPLSIEELCRQWSDGQSASLWRDCSKHEGNMEPVRAEAP
ncbi:hypothetical protein EMCRGX_G016112 [Ephydatia muelleri]